MKAGALKNETIAVPANQPAATDMTIQIARQPRNVRRTERKSDQPSG